LDAKSPNFNVWGFSLFGFSQIFPVVEAYRNAHKSLSLIMSSHCLSFAITRFGYSKLQAPAWLVLAAAYAAK
jgi:hypothetical protein